MRDSTFMALMRLLPKATLSSVVGRITRAPLPPSWHRLAMRAFARRYGVEWAEAEFDASGYGTFSEFFSRRLKPGLREVTEGERTIIAPCDGTVSQIGYAEKDSCVQAKGIQFPIGELLGDPQAAHAFSGGAFATLYLSPRDYHRFHLPLAGKILGYSYLPGQFWPVNTSSVRSKQALFCLNERLITFVETDAAGLMAYVAVGATCVARIRASYDSVQTHAGEKARIHRYEQPIRLEKGAELGWFEMGSTVILLFAPNRVVWDAGVTEGTPVRMGIRLGEVK